MGRRRRPDVSIALTSPSTDVSIALTSPSIGSGHPGVEVEFLTPSSEAHSCHSVERSMSDLTTAKSSRRNLRNSCDEGGTLVCFHKDPAVVKVASTAANAGRYFAGCPYWQTDKCRFFRWIELVGGTEKQEKSYKELKMENAKLKLVVDEASEMENKLSAIVGDLKNQKLELEAECNLLRKKVVELKVREGTMKGFTGCLLLLFLVILLLLIMN